MRSDGAGGRVATVSMILLLSWLPSAVHAQANDFLRSNPKFVAAFGEVVAPLVQSTVRIQCDGKDTCLGVAIDGDGWVLTKAHDLTGKIVCKLANGRTLGAVIVGVHEPNDLALLKIDARFPLAIAFTDSKSTKAGAWVASVSASKEPAAIGVVSVATRKVKEAYLGVQMDVGPSGVVVKSVLPNSAAAKAGLQAKDILLSVNGKKITDPDQLQQVLADLGPGDTLMLTIRRGDVDLDRKAVLQSREQANDFRSEFQNRLGGELSSRRSGYSVILQHDTVLSPTDCGGPLVDLKGRVIGINISRAGRTETFAIPGENVTPLLADLKSGRFAPKQTPR